MTEPIIRVDRLSKRYRISSPERYRTMRDSLSNALRAPLRLLAYSRARRNGRPDYIWAVKDVCFEVRSGEVLGLIGRNGAGKTTLLKILSRITRPTVGSAEIRGRVGSLLEVGTGFHPELTGRENVYLSGVVLGMNRRDIQRKFDEIVAFAGVSDFLDTPLKHYSTGMQMRLGFAVAAHLEPEILLIDEVLAVGDLEFQKKCLGKVSEVARGGRTVLFVSHQMTQIRRLCERALWVDQGGIRMAARSADVVNAYEKAAASGSAGQSARGAGQDHLSARFVCWEIAEPQAGGQARNTLSSHGPAKFRFTISVNRPIVKGVLGLTLRDSQGQITWALAESNLQLQPGSCDFDIHVPYFPLIPGVYCWEVAVFDGHQWIDEGQCQPELNIDTPIYMHPYDRFRGALNIPYDVQLRHS